MKKLVRGVVAAVFTLGFANVAAAECFPIDNPDPGTCYRDSGKCSLGTTLFADTTMCTRTDGTVGATFSPAVNVRRIGQGWATWSSPPYSEDPTPYVGFTNGASTLTIQYNEDSYASGAEVEPNVFAVFNVTATFLDSTGGTITTITRAVDGSSGARLFGVECTQAEVRSIRITIDPSAQGFAIAQVHSSAFPAGAESAQQDDEVTPPAVPEGATNNADY